MTNKNNDQYGGFYESTIHCSCSACKQLWLCAIQATPTDVDDIATCNRLKTQCPKCGASASYVSRVNFTTNGQLICFFSLTRIGMYEDAAKHGLLGSPENYKSKDEVRVITMSHWVEGNPETWGEH